jgi:hypothetical protein
MRGAARQGTAELGLARRKHHFVYCCVIAAFIEALPEQIRYNLNAEL